MTRVNMPSSQSHFTGDSSQVKSSHLGEISIQVKSSQNVRLESTRVRVSDLTCYNTAYQTVVRRTQEISRVSWTWRKKNTEIITGADLRLSFLGGGGRQREARSPLWSGSRAVKRALEESRGGSR